MSKIILEMRNITKEFPGVKALQNVNLKIKEGEIHALCGENGAGKSTLMKVLSGVYPHGSYTGDILFNGNVCKFKDIKQSEELGIVIIHQELALIPYLSIAENIFLGNEQAKNGIINWNETVIRTRELLKKVGLNESPNTKTANLGVGKQQLTEIAKALSKNVKLLILDEPTAALNEHDSENLLNLLLELKKQGMSAIIISHKLNEISKVADSITILRDGQTVETLDMKKDKISEDRIIKGMVGRELTNRYPKREAKIGNTIFEVKNWNVFHPLHTNQKSIDNVNFHIRKGEI
ncbi:ATP-binding cassette domain-containing protein, partial [Neobacillus drentensis]